MNGGLMKLINAGSQSVLYDQPGSIALGHATVATGTSSIAIGYNARSRPTRQVKKCHKNCKVIWTPSTGYFDDPVVECQVHLQTAVWETLYQHPLYYPGKLPKDIIKLISELIKDQEKGDYVYVHPDSV